MPLPPREDRYFEDYHPGDVFEFGDELITEDEIIAFAKRYDPQFFHTDPQAAASTPYGGLIASGWMTAGTMMRMMVEHYVPGRAGLGSPGVDKLRWPNPVRPGDRLRVRVTVTEARRSQSKPDRGIVSADTVVLNQDGQPVMTVDSVMLMLARHPA